MAGMMRRSLKAALAEERPLVTPLAHDALTARLIEQAGFRAFTVGGSALVAARHAYPDIGLIGLTDMADGLRDLAAASSLPFLADGDDGYGDVKSVVRMIEAYEAIGVGGVLIEDQLRDHKQQRGDKAIGVAGEAVIEAKLKAALATRRSNDTMIIGRTDSYGVLGLDGALKRAERYLSLGVDGIYVPGLRTPQELAKVGRTFKGAFISVAMFEDGQSPWLSPRELGEMGFTHVSFPASLIFRAASAMAASLSDLRAYAEGRAGFRRMANFAEARALMDKAVGLARWRQIESDFAAVGGGR
jgi:2-methylisocitrate lyase-like PEP mutase family enzyme